MAKIADKWLQNPPTTGTPNQEVPTGVINGINTDFVVANTPISGTLQVFVNGLLATNYSFDVPTKTITFTTAPALGQTLRAEYDS